METFLEVEFVYIQRSQEISREFPIKKLYLHLNKARLIPHYICNEREYIPMQLLSDLTI